MLNTITAALKPATTAAIFLSLAMPAAAQTFSIPAAPPLTQKTDLGFQSPGFLEVSALGFVDLASDTHYLVFADGATAIPYTSGTFTWTAEGGPYPTFAGGDGINHYRGGGTNWQGSFWNELGAQSTDTLNPATIRFGTLVGTFNPAPAASDWFVIGRHATIQIPATGAHLYAAISDCATCRPDNAFAFAVTVGKRIYSLRDDFDSTHNPSGPWSYGFRLATDAPSAFTRFSTNYAGYQQVVGGWDGTDQPGVTLPGV